MTTIFKLFKTKALPAKFAPANMSFPTQNQSNHSAEILRRFTASRRWFAVRSVIALLLGITATLKLYQLFVSGDNGSLLSLVGPRFVLSVAIIEIGLCIWLLMNIKPVLAWLSCFGLFLMMSLISVVNVGFMPCTSCGCFGAISVAPSVPLVIDIGCLALLIYARPSFLSVKTAMTNNLIKAVWGGLGFVVVLTIVNTPTSWFKPLSIIRGETLVLGSDIVWLQPGPAMESQIVEVQISNNGFKDTRIYGCHVPNNVEAVAGLPLIIARGETKRLQIKYTYPEQCSRLVTSQCRLLTNNSNQPVLVVRFIGRVTPVGKRFADSEP